MDLAKYLPRVCISLLLSILNSREPGKILVNPRAERDINYNNYSSPLSCAVVGGQNIDPKTVHEGGPRTRGEF